MLSLFEAFLPSGTAVKLPQCKWTFRLIGKPCQYCLGSLLSLNTCMSVFCNTLMNLLVR
jgi:hypothetical protein